MKNKPTIRDVIAFLPIKISDFFLAVGIIIGGPFTADCILKRYVITERKRDGKYPTGSKGDTLTIEKLEELYIQSSKNSYNR